MKRMIGRNIKTRRKKKDRKINGYKRYRRQINEKDTVKGAWHVFESGGTKWRYICVCVCITGVYSMHGYIIIHVLVIGGFRRGHVRQICISTSRVRDDDRHAGPLSRAVTVGNCFARSSVCSCLYLGLLCLYCQMTASRLSRVGLPNAERSVNRVNIFKVLTRPCRKHPRPCMTDSCSAARPRTFAREPPRNSDSRLPTPPFWQLLCGTDDVPSPDQTALAAESFCLAGERRAT